MARVRKWDEAGLRTRFCYKDRAHYCYVGTGRTRLMGWDAMNTLEPEVWPDVQALAFSGRKKTEITSMFGLYKQRNGRTSTEKKNKTEKKQNRKTDYSTIPN
jgi:hypothetical protein